VEGNVDRGCAQLIETSSEYLTAKPLALSLLAHNTAQILQRRLRLQNPGRRRKRGNRTNRTRPVVLLPVSIVERARTVEAQRQGLNVDAEKPDRVAVAPDCCGGENHGG
jgi:hypothetical protein